MENDVLITGLFGLAATIISGWSSYFFTRKKYNSEVDLNLIDKMQKSLDFYMQLSEDNKKVLQETLEKVERLEHRNDVLEGENRELRNQMFSFMSQVCTDLSCSVRKEYKERKSKPKKAESHEEEQSLG